MSATSWQRADVAYRFLDERRATVPYAADQLTVMMQLVEHFLGAPARVLDLGCGDGLLARTVLARYPGASAVLVDHSPPMLDRARAAMADHRDRCAIVEGDLADSLSHYAEGPFDLVVSGFAIHHLEHGRKRSLYEEIYDILRPGGLFLHIEHVASATPGAEALFDKLYIDSITAYTGKPRGEVAAAYHSRPDKADNKLERVERQLAWLEEIGFADVDCYFKWLELAVFAGAKPIGVTSCR
jgi:ubiquinone/menaquinone biosynthesis C-methylase UbiE